ncbi:MAG: hypothetical protein ABSE16_09380 [Verrucomicrobiota bacterium]
MVRFKVGWSNEPQAGSGAAATRANGAGGMKWFMELFVVLSLCVAYFFLVRNYFAYGSPMNGNLFMAGSEKLYRLDQPIMGVHWNGRLSGLLMSGALMDFSLSEHNPSQAQMDRLMNVFGLYHAAWLLLLFLAINFALRNSLFINLGIFAGLMYTFSPASGPFFFPWDMPATLFFTLAVLFFERRQIWAMVAVTCAGSFFMETVLVCALLVLFATHWKWSRRLFVFAAIITFYAVGGKLLLDGLQLQTAALGLSEAINPGGSFSPSLLIRGLAANLKVLFSVTPNHVIFANGGTLVAVLVLGWRKRFLPYMLVILVFLGGVALLGLPVPPGIAEVRVFTLVLPLSLIILSELWLGRPKPEAPGAEAVVPASAWAFRNSFPLLFPLALVAIVLSTGIAAWQYGDLVAAIRQRAQSEPGQYVFTTGSERPANLEAVSQWFQDGYADAELRLALNAQRNRLDATAINHYRHVLLVDTNSVFALNNLALLLATSADPHLRNGHEAVALGERLCELTQYQQAIPLYTLAAACAEAGRFADAVATAQKARATALANGQKDIADANAHVMELYQSGQAYHQSPP